VGETVVLKRKKKTKKKKKKDKVAPAQLRVSPENGDRPALYSTSSDKASTG